MKYAFAFVLIALFAVIVVSHAYPEEAAASSNDGSSAQATAEVQLTPEEEAAIEAMGGRRFWRSCCGLL
uniref:Uncharacterized protein n=1 Tax=Anopheles stephensi TaxID=30069 RepID=A0A182YMJ7_ANOST